jgi:hypothetical protein
MTVYAVVVAVNELMVPLFGIFFQQFPSARPWLGDVARRDFAVSCCNKKKYLICESASPQSGEPPGCPNMALVTDRDSGNRPDAAGMR